MYKKLILFVLLLNSISGISQVEFQNNIISDTSGTVTSVFPCDLDGDNDLDILIASNDTVLWYENLDGLGNFGAEHYLPTNLKEARSVYAIDIDKDGDLDVLSASLGDNKIAWYENLDGSGNFSEEQVISQNAELAYSVIASDLDGDGDFDILSASINDDKIAWYENLDGLGNFSSEKTISLNAGGAWAVAASDLDGDGDSDVLSASIHDNKIAWYENLDGLGNFSSEKTISLDAESVKAVHTSDLDGDGDLDVLSASQLDDKVAWYENLDGLGNFSGEKIITTNLDGAVSVFAADLDGDNDMDVIASSQNNGKIAWYENSDGLGSFVEVEPAIFFAFPAVYVYSEDLDKDGDMDILTASTNNSLAWHKNLRITSTADYTFTDFAIYPNPLETLLNVKSNFTIAKVELYDCLGQLILTSTDHTNIDISTIPSGVYVCLVKNTRGKYGIRKVVKI